MDVGQGHMTKEETAQDLAVTHVLYTISGALLIMDCCHFRIA